MGRRAAASKLISQQGLQNYRRQRRGAVCLGLDPFLGFPYRDGRDGPGTNRFTREVISIRTFVKAAPRGKGRIDVQHDVALSRQQIAVQVGTCSEKVELVSPVFIASTRQQTLLEDLLVEIVVGAMNQGGDFAGVDPLVHRVVVHLF